MACAMLLPPPPPPPPRVVEDISGHQSGVSDVRPSQNPAKAWALDGLEMILLPLPKVPGMDVLAAWLLLFLQHNSSPLNHIWMP